MHLHKTQRTMIYIKIGMQDFLTEENFRKVQEKFIKYDDNVDYDFQLSNVWDSEEIKVTFYEPDITGLEYQYVTIHFLADFLLQEISKLGTYYLSQFIQDLKKQYTIDLKKGFTSEAINKVRIARDSISKAEYLNTTIKRDLFNQLDYIEDGLESYIDNPYPKLKLKLEFKLQRNEVIMFFHLLRENDVICHIEDSDLGRIIDNFAQYFDNSSEDFVAINNSRKELNNYKNFNKSNSKPIQTLQEIFTKPDFYYLNP